MVGSSIAGFSFYPLLSFCVLIFRIHINSILESGEMEDLSLDFSPMLLRSVAAQKASGVFCIILHCESSEKLFIIVVISYPKSVPSLGTFC